MLLVIFFSNFNFFYLKYVKRHEVSLLLVIIKTTEKGGFMHETKTFDESIRN